VRGWAQRKALAQGVSVTPRGPPRESHLAACLLSLWSSSPFVSVIRCVKITRHCTLTTSTWSSPLPFATCRPFLPFLIVRRSLHIQAAITSTPTSRFAQRRLRVYHFLSSQNSYTVIVVSPSVSLDPRARASRLLAFYSETSSCYCFPFLVTLLYYTRVSYPSNHRRRALLRFLCTLLVSGLFSRPHFPLPPLVPVCSGTCDSIQSFRTACRSVVCSACI
jgi:hypothetical protein